MKKTGALRAAWLLGSLCVLLLCLSCLGPSVAPTPTPDYPALEMQVVQQLAATLTAKAPPTATRTPTPTREPATPTPELLPSETPTLPGGVVVDRALVAFARQAPDGAMNIVLRNLADGSETILTHFVESQHMRDLSWSRDGDWLIFVSAHDYIHSRRNERNVYAMRPDGTELQMIGGDYMDPATAPGPYVTLRGQVQGGQGVCRVCAQGAADVVGVGEDGSFELPGVPVKAAWARAVCQDGELTLQGVVDLSLSASNESAVSIAVQAGGQGWSQASLSRDNRLFAGIYYLWSVNEEGVRSYTSQGVLYDWERGAAGVLELPPDTTLLGVDWSPVADELVGALTGEEATWLWRWDAQGKSLGAVLEIPNSERLILSAANPAWSADGTQIVFDLREWDWWEESQRRTELMLVRVGEQEATRLVETDWGVDAVRASWAPNGLRLYYQLTTGDPGEEVDNKLNGTIWTVTLDGVAEPVSWAPPELSFYPAARPRLPERTPTPTSTVTPS